MSSPAISSGGIGVFGFGCSYLIAPSIAFRSLILICLLAERGLFLGFKPKALAMPMSLCGFRGNRWFV